MDWPLIWFALGLPTTAALLIWSTFAMIHADEAKSRRRAMQGASTEDLKRVERELADIQQELKKRQSPNG